MDISLQKSSRRRSTKRTSFLTPLLYIYTATAFVVLLSVVTGNSAYARESNEVESLADPYSEIHDMRLAPTETSEEIATFDPITVEIRQGEVLGSYLVTSYKVEDILQSLQIEYSEGDKIYPALNDYVASGLITVVRVDNESEYVIEPIPFQTTYEKDASMYVGEEKLLQNGKTGELKTTFALVYEDGELVSKEVTSSETLSQPVNEVIAIGTKAKAPVVVIAYPTATNSCPYWYSVVNSVTSDSIEREWLKQLMTKESGCNAGNANNPPYIGLFQFSPKTFSAYGGTNIWDGNQQINIALGMYRLGGCQHHWNFCADDLK